MVPCVGLFERVEEIGRVLQRGVDQVREGRQHVEAVDVRGRRCRDHDVSI